MNNPFYHSFGEPSGFKKLDEAPAPATDGLGLATGALVSGILALCSLICCCSSLILISPVFSLASVALAIASRVITRRFYARATVGLVLGVVSLALCVLFLLLIVIVVLLVPDLFMIPDGTIYYGGSMQL